MRERIRTRAGGKAFTDQRQNEKNKDKCPKVSFTQDVISCKRQLFILRPHPSSLLGVQWPLGNEGRERIAESSFMHYAFSESSVGLIKSCQLYVGSPQMQCSCWKDLKCQSQETPAREGRGAEPAV